MNKIDFNKLFRRDGEVIIFQNSFPVGTFTAERRPLADLAPDKVILEFVGTGEDDGARLEFGFTKKAWLEAKTCRENPNLLSIMDIHGDTVNLEFACLTEINLTEFAVTD
ncbi:MAG TPA: hypothetical protein VK308_03660 [Pyrinomonadaceae bacterium]|nr:hypothetical protein [Pyrinomonadaceae bacterium]